MHVLSFELSDGDVGRIIVEDYHIEDSGVIAHERPNGTPGAFPPDVWRQVQTPTDGELRRFVELGEVPESVAREALGVEVSADE